MDFTYFIQNKDKIEVANKPGLYAIMQSNLPPSMQAYRCGLAGKPVDSATTANTQEGSFSSRFATYLNYWLPTNAKVFACLTVPRTQIQGFAEKVMPPRAPGDNREDYARQHLGSTLIEIREKEYHSLLLKNGLFRLGLPTTKDENKRSEFFRGDLQKIIRSLREIGTGDLYLFKDNNISNIQKIELKKRNIKQITPEHIELRKSARSDAQYEASQKVINQLAAGDRQVAKALAQLNQITVTNPTTTTQTPININLTKKQADALKNGDKTMQTAVNKINQIRRSPRLNPNN